MRESHGGEVSEDAKTTIKSCIEEGGRAERLEEYILPVL